MKKLLYLYPYDFQEVFLDKDVGLIPKYFSGIFNLKIDIALFDDYKVRLKTIKYYEDYDKVNVNFYKRIFNIKNKRLLKILFPIDQLSIIGYLIKNIKKYEFIMMFHFSLITWFYLFVCKLINKDLKVILKLDIDRENSIRISSTKINIFKRMMRKSIINKSDLITCETMETYQILTNSLYFSNEKITYLPNGLDEKTLISYKTSDIIDKKENILLTVGRLGEYQKNTEMILEAIKDIDLTGWKVFFVGTMTKEFEFHKDSFIKENPILKDKLIFKGPVFDRDELYDLFARSKCFILSSRFESYGLVLNEAHSFLNYIISTNVGAANDIIESQRNGMIIEQNAQSLKDVLEDFLKNEKVYCERVYANNRESLGWCNIIERNHHLRSLIEGK